MKLFIIIAIVAIVYAVWLRPILSAKNISEKELSEKTSVSKGMTLEEYKENQEKLKKITEKELKVAFKQLVDLLLHNGDKTLMKDKIEALEFEDGYVPVDHFHKLGAELNKYNFKPNDHIPGVSYVALVDWKQDVEDLNWLINSALGGQVIPNLPTKDDYPEYTTVTNERVFPEYGSALAAAGISMRLLNNDSDTHFIIFHAEGKTQEVEQVLQSLGVVSGVFN